MPTEDVKAIGASLTKAQREKLLRAYYGPHGWKASTMCPPLSRLGITEPGSTKLTPLGLAVRATLEQNHD